MNLEDFRGMNLEEKRQIYLSRFPAIISNRMVEQMDDTKVFWQHDHVNLVMKFRDEYWTAKEGEDFWTDILNLYFEFYPIYHFQILDIFHKHGIKP